MPVLRPNQPKTESSPTVEKTVEQPVVEGPFFAFEHVFTSDAGNQRVVFSLTDAPPTAPNGYPKYYHQTPPQRKFNTKAERDLAVG